MGNFLTFKRLVTFKALHSASDLKVTVESKACDVRCYSWCYLRKREDEEDNRLRYLYW